MNRDAQRPSMQVWYSNQLERLADRMIENLGETNESPTNRLFAMPPIIVPNPNIATYLKYEIARSSGDRGGAEVSDDGRVPRDLDPSY